MNLMEHALKMKPNWGDVPTWLAVIAAVVAGIIAFCVYRIESERDRHARGEVRRGQADRVAGWYGILDGSSERAGLCLRNGSDLPVYALRMWLEYVLIRSDGTRQLNRSDAIDEIDVIPPNSTQFTDAPEAAVRDILRDMGDAQCLVTLEFRDAAGVRWRRDRDGVLTELT